MSFAFIIMGLVIVSFVVLAGGIMAVTEAPFILEIPFGVGPWLVSNTPSIIAGSLFIFLTSLMLMRGSLNWIQMLLVVGISIAAFFTSGGVLW